MAFVIYDNDNNENNDTVVTCISCKFLSKEHGVWSCDKGYTPNFEVDVMERNCPFRTF